MMMEGLPPSIAYHPAHYRPFSPFRTLWVIFGAALIVVLSIAIKTPFHGIADHVIKSPGIGRKGSYRGVDAKTVVAWEKRPTFLNGSG